MSEYTLNQSYWNQARTATISAFHTLRFWIFEVFTLAGLTIWVLIWQPDWVQGR